MQPSDITGLITLGRPSLHPDGHVAVVAATRPDLDADEYRSALWQVPTTLPSGGTSAPPRRLTHGGRDSAPAHSPDGRWLAFLRSVDGKPPQLHLLPTGGGDARRLTDLPGGAGAPVWSPDSSRLAFSARVPEAGRYGQDEDVPAGKEAPRRITGLQFRQDGEGFVLDRRAHLFVVDVPTAEQDAAADDTDAVVRQLTDGDYEDVGPAWSPDGTQLAFVSSRHDGRESDRLTDLFVLVVGPDAGTPSAEPTRVTSTRHSLHAPVWTPDGSSLLAVGVDPIGRPGWIALNWGLWHVPIGSGQPQRLTDEQSVHLGGDRLVLDTRDGRPVVLVPAENRGALELLAVPYADGAAAEPVVLSTGHRQITGVDVAAGVTVLTVTDPGTAGELARLDLTDDGSTLVPLTDFGAGLRDRLVPVTDLVATAPDGYEVHGFLTVPAGDGPHPVLLMIHGGPFAQYGWNLLDEAQVYSRAGYAVVYGNPRGSSGYGQAHGQFILGDVGARSAPDLLALLDAALTRPDLDAGRVGVLGGSHGGFMTSWLVGHTDRFAAAVSERAVNAIDSFEGSSDIGWDFADSAYGTDPAQRHHQSPLTHADRIDTPLLIIHSEHDWRCPIEQAQRLYVALRKRSAVVEMLLFPGEGHELSRSGLPSHRVTRFEAILEWFGRYLPVA